jgi:hypothetical protein
MITSTVFWPDAIQPSIYVDVPGGVTASPMMVIIPGPCWCECPGCDDQGLHCLKQDRGCGWRKR